MFQLLSDDAQRLLVSLHQRIVHFTGKRHSLCLETYTLYQHKKKHPNSMRSSAQQHPIDLEGFTIMSTMFGCRSRDIRYASFRIWSISSAEMSMNMCVLIILTATCAPRK